MIVWSRMLVLSCLVVLCPLAFAQEALNSLLAAHARRVEAGETQRSLDLVKLKQGYKGALEQAQSAARSQGDLELLLALGKEIERVSETLEAPAPVSEYPALARLQGVLVQQLALIDGEQARRVEAAFRSTDAQLLAVQQDLVRAGKIDAALAVDGKRKAMAQDPTFVAALARLPSPTGSRQVPANLEQASRLFKGKVLAFDAKTMEIEIAYDFSDAAQLQDFTLMRPDQIRVEDGKLVLSAPAGSDWWIKMPFSASALVVPFLEADAMELSIDCLGVSDGEAQHVVMGFSDLDQRTIGLGPLGTIKSFAVEGWTPKNSEFRDRRAAVPQRFPATLRASRKESHFVFATLVDKRPGSLGVDGAPEMKHPGLFAKAWSRKPVQASFDNLIVKGVLRGEWLAGR
jgi:hypothetical protein